MSPRDTDTTPNTNAFVDWVAESPRGQLGADLSEALTECVDATRTHGGKSVLTIKVTIATGSAGLGDLAVGADISTKPAKAPTPAHTYFPTDDGGLSRTDPTNQPLPGMEKP